MSSTFDPRSVTRSPRSGSVWAQLIIDKRNELSPADQIAADALLFEMGLDATIPVAKLATAPRNTLMLATQVLNSLFDEGSGKIDIQLTAAQVAAVDLVGATTADLSIGTLPAGAKVQLAYVANGDTEFDDGGGSLSALTASIGTTAAPTSILGAGTIFAADALVQGGDVLPLGTPHAEQILICRFISTNENIDQIDAGSARIVVLWAK